LKKLEIALDEKKIRQDLLEKSFNILKAIPALSGHSITNCPKKPEIFAKS